MLLPPQTAGELVFGRRGRSAQRQTEAHQQLDEQLVAAQQERKTQERRRDQEKEALIGQLNTIEERNDIRGLINEIFGVPKSGQRGQHA